MREDDGASPRLRSRERSGAGRSGAGRSPAAPAAALLACLGLPSLGWAGPPFITDDPEPVEEGHWEINNALMATHSAGGTAATLPNIDANYGPVADVQAHIQPQMAYAKTPSGTQFGLGDTELGLKYRFLQDGGDEDPTPMVSLYPLVELPTGDSRRGLGAGVTRAFVPVWIQKTIGPWTSYGGGGHWINPGRNLKDAWFGGVTVLYQVTDDLQLGGEAFYQTANTPNGKDSPGFNLGGSYTLTEDLHLLFSAGRGIANSAETNRASGYLALQVLY